MDGDVRDNLVYALAVHSASNGARRSGGRVSRAPRSGWDLPCLSAEEKVGIHGAV